MYFVYFLKFDLVYYDEKMLFIGICGEKVFRENLGIKLFVSIIFIIF